MHHLDNASTSHPKPDGVREAMLACLDVAGSPRRGSHRAAAAAAERLESCRREVAAFLGASDPSRLAFTLNATDALNLAVASLARPGGRVVVGALEHAAVTRPIRRLERDMAVEVLVVRPGEDGRLDPDDVRRACDGACAAFVTCASNVTGIVQPFAEIAEALAPRATPLVLDAAQAAGSVAIDFDSLGAHVALAFTGHKALLGPMGAGGLLVGQALELGPWREGGTGDSLGRLQPESMPARLEAGTPPLPAIAGLAAGVAWWRATGPSRVRAAESRLLERLVRGLLDMDGVRLHGLRGPDDLGQPRVPLIGFRVDGWAVDELALVLESELGIVLRAGLHCAPEAHAHLGTHPDGTLRASLGPTSREEDVDALLEGLRRVIG